VNRLETIFLRSSVWHIISLQTITPKVQTGHNGHAVVSMFYLLLLFIIRLLLFNLPPCTFIWHFTIFYVC